MLLKMVSLWSWLFFFIFVSSVYGGLLEDVDKYNDNFEHFVTIDFEKQMQYRDAVVKSFGELTGAATALDDYQRNVTWNLLHGITERSHKIHLNSERLFDLLNFDELEDTYDQIIETPLSTGILLLKLANTTGKEHVKNQLIKYCADNTIGPLFTMNNLVVHTFDNCPLPKANNIECYFRATVVFLELEKKFVVDDSDYRRIKQDLLHYFLFANDSTAAEEEVQRLEQHIFNSEDEIVPYLTGINAEDVKSGKCWLEQTYTHSQQKVTSYENFGAIVMATLAKLDDQLMMCSALNTTFDYMKKAITDTEKIGKHIDEFKTKFVQKSWPSAVVKRIKTVLPVTPLPSSKYNSTTTHIKHAINLMVEKKTKCHVIISNLMDSENYFTTCIHGTDCLKVQAADVRTFVFLSKNGSNDTKTKPAQQYYSTCRRAIKKVIKENAGQTPAFIWPIILQQCPKLLHFYRHIFFATGFVSEGLTKMGWSYNGYNSYQHIHKFFQPGVDVSGQEYHLFMLMA